MSDLIIDDLLEDKPKKIKSGIKGKSAERQIVNILNKHFAKILSENPTWGSFSRAIGSGNRWAQNVILSEQAKQVYSSDICAPPTFVFTVESKKGYNEVDLCSVFSGKCSELDSFLQQVQNDADRTKRFPLLIWKKDRKKAIAFLKQLPPDLDPNNMSAHLRYGPWIAVPFEELLQSTDDSFWFA